MNNHRSKTSASSESLSSLISEEDPLYRQHFDFNQRKEWIDTILLELENNLKLFFQVQIGIAKVDQIEKRNQLKEEISQTLDDEVDVLLNKLEQIRTALKPKTLKLYGKYSNILSALQQVQQVLPIKKEVLLPYTRHRTEDEKLQWITGILAYKAKIQNLKRKIKIMQAAIDETKLELFVLTERSPREIQDLIDQSELELVALKRSGDLALQNYQNEISKQILSLDQHPEYRDLVAEHEQKRRKITKLTVQLGLWIKQYDKFVGEPMKELKVLQEDVDQFPEWKEAIYDPQDERYTKLKLSVEQFEDEIAEEKAEQFAKHHAARVIQRAWRKLMAKKKAKRKGKKGKGKGKRK
ncbi:uncharacterized protein LOC129760601 [Uranotaenia lowii]|uniref:uncharacterized protein LOC129760601 n=1 Tax=Uranotaenia lowii TaxID=190385 RepID=UPI00247A7A7B|nr:uncharacterized protein LOC129760601 [Uranotaenia lowii]